MYKKILEISQSDSYNKRYNLINYTKENDITIDEDLLTGDRTLQNSLKEIYSTQISNWRKNSSEISRGSVIHHKMKNLLKTLLQN